MDETFAAAQVHRPAPWWARRRGLSGHRVCGRRLRPYCYWHAFLLDAIGSPFAGHLVPFDRLALVKAVEVCALRYPEYPRARGWAWLRQVRAMQLYRSNWMLHLAAFTEYRADYISCPQFLEEPGADPLATPWYLFSVARLQASCGMTEAQAWSTPIAEGQWLCAAAMESGGARLKLITPQMRAELRKLGHNL